MENELGRLGVFRAIKMVFCAGGLLDNENVSFAAHIIKYLWPHGNADFAKVGFFEYHHLCSGLSNSTANAKGDFAVNYGLMIWIL